MELTHEKMQRKGDKRETLERLELSAAHLLGFFARERAIDTIKLIDTTGYMDHRRKPRVVQDKRGFERTIPGVSDRTIAIELGHLQASLQRCLELEMYNKSPRAIWPPELSKQAKRRARWLTSSEYLRMYAALGPAEGYMRGGELCRYKDGPRGHDWREHLAVLCFMGLRAGELYVPTGADVHGSRLWVAGYKTAHATDRAQRYVPIHPEVAPIIERRAAAYPTSPLFPMDSPNLRAQERALLRALHRAAERLEIPRVTENDLRRTFASWCRQDGVDERDVVEWMGHTTSKMVREVYSQSSEEHATEQMAKVRRRRSAPNVPREGPKTALRRIDSQEES